MSDVFVGLGSNLGDRTAHLRYALRALHGLPGTRLAAVSRLHETAPAGGPPQPPYLNAVARLESCLRPVQLLARLQRLEWRRGRVRRERDGPRTLDLDLLLYDAARCSDAYLTLPHPRLEQRRFVLEPLCELAPVLVLHSGRTVRESLRALPA
ncbi:MAG: 2-amino-4-hydroxy-6-hydroxymethyldihydropteridine diphosphokinase [Planctomycetota bacterium]|nr:MAG: 2-amino-4-hydroxy-6-hydroxymethyldihydropteridine diphosphokinase [Planctomycetota bacterium]